VKVAPSRLEERTDIDRHALAFTRVYIGIYTHCEIDREIFLSINKSLCAFPPLHTEKKVW